MMEDEERELRSLHDSMVAAAEAIGAVEKNLRNADSMYNARSIDDILDAVHGPLAAAGIVLQARTLERHTEVRGRMNYSALHVEYTFRGEDGDSLVTDWWGEATDASDKSLPKAYSAALKAAMIQTFTIPVNGPAGDADAHTVDAVRDLEPMATPAQMTELSDRLGNLWKRIGRTAYPRAWTAELQPVPYYRDNGMTARDWTRAVQILTEAEIALDNAPAATDPNADPCRVCGLVPPEHEQGCPEAPGTDAGVPDAELVPETGTGAQSGPVE